MRTISAGCALMLAAGCVGYEPAPLEPEVELGLLEARGVGDVRVDTEPLAVPSTEWFPLQRDVALDDGLSLAEANALALFYAPRLVDARRQARVAGAQVLQSGLLHNPELFVGPRFSTDGGELIMPAGLAWELPLWGQEGAERDRAQALWSAERWQVVTTELDVLAAVRLGFFEVAARGAEHAARQELLAASDRLLTWVEQLQAAGEIDAVTGHLAQLEREEARMQAGEARLAAELARGRLLALIGLLPTSPVEIQPGTSPFALPELPPTDAAALLRHPELRAQAAVYRASEGALRVEIAKQYPSIRLGPEYEYDDGESSVGFGLGFELPLFDRNRGAIAAAEQSRDAARDRYRHELLSLSHREAVARAELESAEALLRSYRERTQPQVEGMQLALPARLRTGLASVLEVIAAQVVLTRVRVHAIELEERAAAARLRAAVAAGAGVRADPTVIEVEELEEQR